MAQVDVVIVIGANDVVNPAAREEKGSPIYGMPIIDADGEDSVRAEAVNGGGLCGHRERTLLFDNCLMLFGDAKAVIGDLVKEFTGEHGGH